MKQRPILLSNWFRVTDLEKFSVLTGLANMSFTKHPKYECVVMFDDGGCTIEDLVFNFCSNLYETGRLKLEEKYADFDDALNNGAMDGDERSEIFTQHFEELLETLATITDFYDGCESTTSDFNPNGIYAGTYSPVTKGSMAHYGFGMPVIVPDDIMEYLLELTFGQDGFLERKKKFCEGLVSKIRST